MCVGARVDRQPYPLSQQLKNGQTVDILTAPGARPNAAWLNYVVTARARTKIRQVLKTMRREESVHFGRRLLNHALGELNIEDISEENVDKVLADLKLKAVDDLLAEIGLGELMSVVIARRLLGDADELTHADDSMPIKGASGSFLLTPTVAAQSRATRSLPTYLRARGWLSIGKSVPMSAATAVSRTST